MVYLNPVTHNRGQPGKCMESLFKVSLTSLLTNGMRREHETAVVEKKKKEIKRCKQHCAASGEMSPIGPFKQCEMPLRARLGRQHCLISQL